ncbi:MAG: Ig-like domain-containing protein [Chloroflexota bacterium]
MKRLTLPAFSISLLLLLLVAGLGLVASSAAQTSEPAKLTAADFSPLGATSSDPTGSLTLTSDSAPPTKLTRQDYLDAYNMAQALLGTGSHFRSRELQRLDPATCVANNDDPDACSFSVTGIENNYLDFSNGRLYWRFCADYDEPYVGVGAIPQAVDDPGNQLKLDLYGYCPTWDKLSQQQKTRRVANGDLSTGDGSGPSDIRNQMIDAQRLFAALVVAEPANLTFDFDILTVDEDGSISKGADGENDRVRDLGRFGLLETTRELANVHLIFGNEFMVDALRFPFSTDIGGDTEQLVRDEQKQLERALHHYNLSIEMLLYTLNFNLNTATDNIVGDLFTNREFQLFSAASERTVTALTELAKRDRLLGQNGDQAALDRLEKAMEVQYLQAAALAQQAAALTPDDPATDDINESKLRFMDNGGRDIMNNIRRLEQQAQNIRAGLNPLGYENAFVPLKPFEELLQESCGAKTFCTDNGGLLNSAVIAAEALQGSNRDFDEKFDALKDALTSLQNDFDDDLTTLCGASADNNGDGLKDFETCGFKDPNGNGKIDNASETSGLMGQNYWDMLAAEQEVSLVARRIENNVERIRREEELANERIRITLGTAVNLSAYQIAIGKLNAMQTTQSVATSNSETDYLNDSFSTTGSNKTTVTVSGNPLHCFFGGCSVTNETSLEVALNRTSGTNIERTHISTSEFVYSPNEAIIGQFESLITLKNAEKEARLAALDSQQLVFDLLLEQTELLIELQIAQTQFNKVVAEHNLLVDQYLLKLTQRQGTIDALQTSYLSKPYFRLFRDSAALGAASTLDQATQLAYLTAKALEYHTLSPVSYMEELYRVRNPANLRAFLEKLARDYNGLPNTQFSKATYRLSLAEDLLGLSDTNLNPDGTLTPEEVTAVRDARFQALLQESRITNAETGFDSIVFLFSTSLDDPKFSTGGVFNHRISRTSSGNDGDPGCKTAIGCRGVWLNMVTAQDPADFGDSLPRILLSHGGQATYRDGNLHEVSYDPGPALMIGHSLPPGFDPKGRVAALMTTHINLGLGAEPNGNLIVDNFYNLSVAATQWRITIDLKNTVENSVLDLNQLKDIEIRMDTTFVTASQFQRLAALEQQRIASETYGTPLAADVVAGLAEEMPRWETAVRAAQQTESQPAHQQQTNDTNAYTGTMYVNTPVQLGIMELGFNLDIGADGAVTGTLCHRCSTLYPSDEPDVAITGSYNATTNQISFQTDVFSRPVAGRTATQQVVFNGEVKEDGTVIEGTYSETLNDYTAVPVVSTGDFLVARLVGQSFEGNAQLLLQVNPLEIGVDDTATVTATLLDGLGQPVANSNVTFSTTLGQLAATTATTDADGVATTTLTATVSGMGTVSVSAANASNSRGFEVAENLRPRAVDDVASTEVETAVSINILANDSDPDGSLDPSTVTIIAQPSHGTLSVDPSSGVVTYTPNTDFSGTDSFGYRVKDNEGRESNTATVTITVGTTTHLIYLPTIRK